MEIKKSVLIITILYLLSSIAISFVYKVKYNKLNNEYNKVITELEYYHNIDTNAIHKIDSIEYNIRQKDSIIFQLKPDSLHFVILQKIFGLKLKIYAFLSLKTPYLCTRKLSR